jgi:hypothetical protein
MKKLIFGF